MEENNEVLDKKTEELYSKITNLQQGLIEKNEQSMQYDKYGEELEIMAQLCKKIMNLHKSNVKRIDELEK